MQVPKVLPTLAVAMFACSLAAPVSAAPTTITFVGWGMPEEQKVMAEALAAYERANPGHRVAYTQIPGGFEDYFNKLRLMIVAGMAPDVYYVPDGNFGALASRGVLLDLEPYVARSTKIKLADMWPSAVNRFRWDGKQLQKGTLYCLPKDIGPNAMYYNKDVFRARGVPLPDPKTPWTWDEAIAAWKKLSWADGRIRHYGVTGYPQESAVWSNGGEILAPDNRRWVLGTDPRSLEAVQWCADLALVHGVAPDAAKTARGAGSMSTEQLFESGLGACHIDGRWKVPRYRKIKQFDWDVAPIPVPRKGAKSVCWSGSVGFGIARTSPHPQAAFSLVEFLAGPDGQAIMTRSGMQVPNQRWLAKSPVYIQPGERPAHPEVFLDAVATSRPGPWASTPNTFWHDVYWTFIGKVFRGERKASDLLPELAPLINNALSEGNP